MNVMNATRVSSAANHVQWIRSPLAIALATMLSLVSATSAAADGGARPRMQPFAPGQEVASEPIPQSIPLQPVPMLRPPAVTGNAPLSTMVPSPPVLAPISVQPVEGMTTRFPSPQAPASIVIDHPSSVR